MPAKTSKGVPALLMKRPAMPSIAFRQILLAALPLLACSGPGSTGARPLRFSFPVVDSPHRSQCSISFGTVIAHRGGLTRFIKYELGGHQIDFKTRESINARRYHSECSVSTTYVISCIRERHPDQIYVAGYDEQTGESIIEEITLRPQEGALGGFMPKAESGFGFPTPYTWPEVKVIGDVFVPPTEREKKLGPIRVEIYRGTDFSGISGLSADPEGRFFIVQDYGTGDLYQLTVGGGLEKIVSSAEHPNIRSALLRPAMQSGFVDRIYCFMQSADGKYVVLHDRDNDCVFDSIQFLTRDGLMEAFPLEPYGPYQLVR